MSKDSVTSAMAAIGDYLMSICIDVCLFAVCRMASVVNLLGMAGGQFIHIGRKCSDQTW